MTEDTYIAATDTLEPLVEEYLRLRGRFVVPENATQEDYNRVHAEFVTLRDAELATFCLTIDDLEDECLRRLEAKKGEKIEQ